jgi:hypothetical protein
MSRLMKARIGCSGSLERCHMLMILRTSCLIHVVPVILNSQLKDNDDIIAHRICMIGQNKISLQLITACLKKTSRISCLIHVVPVITDANCRN